MNTKYWLILLAGSLMLAGCGKKAHETVHDAQVAAAHTRDSMKLPATTSSAAALGHYGAGWSAYEMVRANDAKAHFAKAIEADPNFAAAHLMMAVVATSTEGFASSLANAASHAAGASRGEQLLIESFQKAFEGDQAGRLAAVQALTALHPDSPRALLFEAQVHGNANDTAATLKALNRAVELDPTSSAAHMQLGNTYMFLEPKDFDKAEAHIMKAVALSPNEPNPYDLLGDVHRAQGNIEAAYDDYTKAAELAPTMGSPLQQRGHVNSFLGNYDEARADYTRAAELEDARGTNNGGFFLVFRAFVNLHEGKLDPAIAELEALAAKADSMGTEGNLDLKINAHINAIQIAAHKGDAEKAGALIAAVAGLLRQQAKDLDNAEFTAGQEATISYLEGRLAARMGDTAAAQAKAKEYEHHVANVTNPRKLEQAHEILGMSDFYNKDYSGAARHLAAGDVVNDMYIKYHLALAQAESGNDEEARRLFKELAAWNFNGVGYAMTRSDILARVSEY